MQVSYTMNYNPATAMVDATINGVAVASESSYLAADAIVQPLREVVAAARLFLATLMAPAPTPAAPAAQPKARKSKSTKVCGEQCPACHPQAAIADGVYYCAAGREFNVYFNGSLAQVFPKKDVMQAHALLNNLRTESLRRRAA